MITDKETKVRELLLGVADDNSLTISGKSIEQKQRNTIKRNLTEAMFEVLQEIIGDTSLLTLYRTKEGLMVGIDNERIGIIPLEIKVAVKNMDCDPEEEAIAYQERLAEAEDKKRRAEAAKASKIAAQSEARELKRQLRALKNGERTPIQESEELGVPLIVE